MQKSTVIFWDFDETLGYRDGKWTQTVLDLLAVQGITDLIYDDISPRLKEIYPWGRPDRSHELYMEGLSPGESSISSSPWESPKKRQIKQAPRFTKNT